MAMLMTFLIVMLPVCFADSLSLTYDDNGNLVTGDGVYRVYNSLNQLWKVYNNTDTTTILQEYVYHPTEERILIKKHKKLNKNIFNSWDLQSNVPLD